MERQLKLKAYIREEKWRGKKRRRKMRSEQVTPLCDMMA